MKKFQEVLMKDLGWKLLSVAIAAIMWFMVININQPVDTRTYSKNIVLENMDVLTSRGLTVSNATELTDRKANIKIKAQRTALDRLNQAMDWLGATVDLASLAYAMDGDVVTLPVEVAMQGVYSGYNIMSKSPAVVEVQIEKISSKEMPIDVVLNGELPLGSKYEAPKLSNNTVVVTGPASAVAKVAAVRATVNAQEVAQDVQLRAKLMAYDAGGVPVKGVATAVSEITVSYRTQEQKSIPIQVNILGTPATGFEVGQVFTTPATIEVTGTAEALENFVYLQVPDIDVTGSKASVVKTVTISRYLPTGVSLKEGASTTVQITVELVSSAGVEMTIDATQVSPVGAEDGKSYTISGSFQVSLSGASDVLNGLNESEISGNADVSGLAPGHHRVLVDLVLPQDVTASYGYIDVLVEEDGSASGDES